MVKSHDNGKHVNQMTKLNSDGDTEQVLRDIQLNVICDLFGQEIPQGNFLIIAFNKIPSIEKVKKVGPYNQT